MQFLETAKEALDKIERRAYDKLSDYGKAAHDEKKRIAADAKRLYGSSVIGTKRPGVRKAIK